MNLRHYKIPDSSNPNVKDEINKMIWVHHGPFRVQLEWVDST